MPPKPNRPHGRSNSLPNALGRASYAAEFLKRNPAYRAEHARMQAHIASGSVPRATAEDAFARRWGLSFRSLTG